MMRYPEGNKCDDCGFGVQFPAHPCACGPWKTIRRLEAALNAAETRVATACASCLAAGLGNIANGQRPPVDWLTYVHGECDALQRGAWRSHVDASESNPTCAVPGCANPLNIQGQTLCSDHLNEALDARGLDWKPS